MAEDNLPMVVVVSSINLVGCVSFKTEQNRSIS